MSLPWVPIYLDSYTSNTMHLTCEEHGAYFQLMLAYYRSEKPLPASDRSLAAIVKLPMERWLEAKPVLAAFFREQGGLWHHDRIEHELASRADKHAKSSAAARAGAVAMHTKKGHNLATSNADRSAEAVRKHNSSRKPALGIAQALPKALPPQCESDAHLHIHPSITEGEDALPKSENLDEVGTPIDPAFRPTDEQLAICAADGASEAMVNHQIEVFIATKQDDGAFSHDWQAAWWKWWLRWREHKAKQEAATKPKPRVEVSNAPPDWPAHAARWASGMGWPRGVGGEPGTTRCRCPRELLMSCNIDPDTGLKLVPEKV